MKNMKKNIAWKEAAVIIGGSGECMYVVQLACFANLSTNTVWSLARNTQVRLSVLYWLVQQL